MKLLVMLLGCVVAPFKMISAAFLADEAAVKDPNLPSGLRPIRGDLRSSGLSKLEKSSSIESQGYDC